MNTKPLSQNSKLKLNGLQKRLDELRKKLGVQPPGALIFSAYRSPEDDEHVIVEADGYGGATLRVVAGDYPSDYTTTFEQNYATESSALDCAEDKVLE
jgi:hypothetical protein